MTKIKRFGLVIASLLITILGMPGTAGAAGFDQFVGLGDSTIDTGYFRYNLSGDPALDSSLPAAIADGAKGGWAGNGVVGVTILGDKFGISTGSVRNGNGGTNYANGAGFTNDPGPMPGSEAATQQIRNYLNSVGGVANPHALYVVSSGNNDLLQHKNLTSAASAIASSVSDLQRAGARTILVPNSFLYAVYAAPGGGMDPANAAAYDQAVWYNTLRWSNMRAAGVHYIPADLDSVFRYVVQHPTAFGLTSYSVLSASHPSSVSAILSDNSHITQAQQQTFLFIDGHHLTTAGQTIEADYEYSLLTAPSEVSLMAESAVQNGWTRTATIQGQIEASAMHCRSCGRNFWTTAGVYNTKVRNAPGFTDDSGSPFGGSIGMDYQLESGLILGAAFTFASQSQRFSTGGHFNQVDEAPSLYLAYMNGPLWGNAVLTYDLFQDNVARIVPLGTNFTDFNNAFTTGQSLSLALRGGRDFSRGRITTGPVVGLIMQQAFVDDFTEAGDTGITALSFHNQTRNSLVSQFGWRALVDCDKLQPFVEANWNHEWADKNRTVITSLTTVDAPSYSMDAVPIASDWATLSLGSFYKLSPRAILRAAATGMFANPQMENYGGELGLNVSF